ncbi:MAG: hypothetical protein ABJH05_09210 [Fulvivirga sp.]
MSNLEKISAYLENDMSVVERQEFEQAVAKDPELKQELDLQRDIIEGIRDARRSELKAIMDNVPIGGSMGIGGSITFGKLASGIAIVGLLSLGAYYLIDDNDSSEFMPPKSNTNIDIPEIDNNLASTNEIESKSEVDDNEGLTEVAEPNKTETKTSEPVATNNNETADPEINRPTAAPIFETSESDSLEAPTNEIVDNIEGNLTSLDVEIDNTKKKYSFHYQFNRGKLFLYGDFDRELYEILEFKTKSDKTLFLYYEGKFYPLNKQQVKIVELKPVKERTLIEKLEKVVDIE